MSEENTAGGHVKVEIADRVAAVTLDRPVVASLRIVFSTASTGKGGAASTGSATGGTSCTGDVDYLSFAGREVPVSAGSSTATSTGCSTRATSTGPGRPWPAGQGASVRAGWSGPGCTRPPTAPC